MSVHSTDSNVASTVSSVGSVHITHIKKQEIQGKLKINPATCLESSRGLVRRQQNRKYIKYQAGEPLEENIDNSHPSVNTASRGGNGSGVHEFGHVRSQRARDQSGISKSDGDVTSVQLKQVGKIEIN